MVQTGLKSVSDGLIEMGILTLLAQSIGTPLSFLVLFIGRMVLGYEPFFGKN